MFSDAIDAALTAYEVGEWVWNRITKGQVRVVVFGSDGISLESFSAAYFEKQREHEIATLERFAGQIALAPHRLSLLTVVTKQDLWWGERQKVRSFYESGRYADTVETIRNQIGSQNFSHNFCSASLLYRNLVDGEGNILRMTTAGYDDKIKLRHQQMLLELIRAEAAHG